MNISNYLASALLNQVFRNTAYTRPSTVYVALYTSNPTAADTGTELSGGGYARLAVTFAAPTAEGGKQVLKNSTQVQFGIASADWGTVTHIGLKDAATGGNLLFFGAVDNPRTILTNDRLTVSANNLTLTLS
ncbi:hypothetical protein [Paenibacillus sp. YN15]|uniref:phage tail fiber protein n=1 Tax=Paenibacillus sp. YN15 TaxID=1742774 RepID=UPI000DCEEB97|nr:hypothetical protein [Paenibacillus sp. YN15]RAV05164.1 hypothetical protein DQG13_04655 [Paenibacillus sp. YN15]